MQEGWKGWDAYAPFYDWENARTLGRRDVPFWRRLASTVEGTVLELGCGTGHVSVPLVRAGVRLIGIDRSAAMLQRARDRLRRLSKFRDRGAEGPRYGRNVPGFVRLIRGDVRALPFADRQFAMALAPYGMLQSLLTDRDLDETIASVARVLPPGGIFATDLVPDVPRWRGYENRVQLRGRVRGGAHLTPVESVR